MKKGLFLVTLIVFIFFSTLDVQAQTHKFSDVTAYLYEVETNTLTFKVTITELEETNSTYPKGVFLIWETNNIENISLMTMVKELSNSSWRFQCFLQKPHNTSYIKYRFVIKSPPIFLCSRIYVLGYTRISLPIITTEASIDFLISIFIPSFFFLKIFLARRKRYLNYHTYHKLTI